MKVYTKFPQGADKMVQFFDWEMDELIPLAFFLIFGLVLKNPVIMLLGFFVMKLYIKGKQRFPNNFVFIFLYSIGILTERRSIPGFVKNFME